MTVELATHTTSPQPGLPSGLAARYYRVFAGTRRILDVGCGNGSFGRYRPREIEIQGIDRDRAALALASEYENTVWVDLDTDALPFEDEYFDAVLAKDVLEHLQDPARVCRELHRVLRPHGVLVASVVMAVPKRVWADYTHVRGFTRESTRRLVEDAGFDVEAIWRMGGVPGANRLGLMDLVPYVLRLPGLSHLWASSWELKARRRT